MKIDEPGPKMRRMRCIAINRLFPPVKIEQWIPESTQGRISFVRDSFEQMMTDRVQTSLNSSIFSDRYYFIRSCFILISDELFPDILKSCLNIESNLVTFLDKYIYIYDDELKLQKIE